MYFAHETRILTKIIKLQHTELFLFLSLTSLSWILSDFSDFSDSQKVCSTKKNDKAGDLETSVSNGPSSKLHKFLQNGQISIKSRQIHQLINALTIFREWGRNGCKPRVFGSNPQLSAFVRAVRPQP